MKTQPRHPRKIPVVLPEETSPAPVTNTDDSGETTSNSNLVDDATPGSDSPTVPLRFIVASELSFALFQPSGFPGGFFVASRMQIEAVRVCFVKQVVRQQQRIETLSSVDCIHNKASRKN